MSSSGSMTSKKQSADCEFNKALSEILTIVQNQANAITELTNKNTMILEILHNVNERSEDVSKKFDAILNVECGKPKIDKSLKPKQKNPPDETLSTKGNTKDVKETSGDTAVTTNVMRYFKVKYTEDSKYFNDILEENQAESVIAENADKLKNKKKGAAQSKEILSLIYKSLTKDQKKEVKLKMTDENKQNTVQEQELDVIESKHDDDSD